jgi:hypothetical protein
MSANVGTFEAQFEAFATAFGSSRASATKPRLLLPGNEVTFQLTAQKLFPVLAQSGKFFRRGQIPVELARDGKKESLVILDPSVFRVRIADYFNLYSQVAPNGRAVREHPALCSESAAKSLLGAFWHMLPEIRLVANSPVFAEQEGKLIVLGRGVHRGLYVMRDLDVPEDIPEREAIESLQQLLCDYDFLSDGDRSRAIASLI